MSFTINHVGIQDGYRDAISFEPDGFDIVRIVHEIENDGFNISLDDDYQWLESEGFL